MREISVNEVTNKTVGSSSKETNISTTKLYIDFVLDKPHSRGGRSDMLNLVMHSEVEQILQF